MNIDLKWPAALMFPFAVMAWIDFFFWAFGLEWGDDGAREAVALIILIFGGVPAILFACLSHSEGVRWNVRLPIGRKAQEGKGVVIRSSTAVCCPSRHHGEDGLDVSIPTCK
jgi:hypothetical protein